MRKLVIQGWMARCRFCTVVAISALMGGCVSADQSEELPNIIYVLADDLGYGELGSFGQEIIETPHLDTLAANGMRFSQHYSGAPVCAPARCVLLTGMHSGHAYIRGNDEWGSRGLVWDYQEMFDHPHLEGQRPLPDSIETLAELLKRAGYNTGMIGKWGLGAPDTESVPNKQGFDYFLGYNCQRQAHTLYPMHLWKNEEKLLLDNKNVPIHANLPAGADPSDPSSYADFKLNEYAPTVMHEGALEFLDQQQDAPFFLYYASPIPHVPLQAPQRWVDYYRQKIGPEEPHTGNSYFPCLAPRATYAAMVSYLDEQVGELIAKLKEQGKYENTLIIFSSDNGPSYTGGTDSPFFDSAGPFKSEHGWGKGFVHEGGIRVPMIAAWPAKVRPNRASNHISGFQDVMATIADVVGVVPKANLDGLSFLPELMGDPQPEHDYLYWEFPAAGGQQAVRKGNWKAIRRDVLKGNLDIQLYNLKHDPQELDDVAEANPEIVEEMRRILSEARTMPELDRFRMEALGDVQQSARDAQERVESLSTVARVEDNTLEYFSLGKQTSLEVPSVFASSVELLQQRLMETGNYRLTTRKNAGSKLTLQSEGTLQGDAFTVTIEPSEVLIKASSVAGFSSGVETLISLMDKSISEDHLMHNPRWMISVAKIRSL